MLRTVSRVNPSVGFKSLLKDSTGFSLVKQVGFFKDLLIQGNLHRRFAPIRPCAVGDRGCS
jgi:hypothetical protein